MPSLKDLRKRRDSVRSTQQITKAMKMVAAAGLRRAQERAERARPYAAKLTEMFSAVVSGLSEAHPLLARREEKRIDLIVLTSDRGLCGGYNANLLRQAETFLREHSEQQVHLLLVGRKALDYYRRRRVTPLFQRTGVLNTPTAEVAAALAERVTTRFAAEETDAVYLLYTRFQSALTQIPTLARLLPVDTAGETEGPAVDYIFEPPRPELLGILLPRYIETRLLQALLEAIASEFGARMTAMDNASRNASEMIDRLTLSMNRARQAAITTELMEIVSGAEALKG
jgi:F-type H+-transporting ATPase subunit gamma